MDFYSQSKVDSQRFVKYICDQVLPQWDSIASLKQGDLLQLAILRQLAELSTHCGRLENPSLHVVQIFDKIKVGSAYSNELENMIWRTLAEIHAPTAWRCRHKDDAVSRLLVRRVSPLRFPPFGATMSGLPNARSASIERFQGAPHVFFKRRPGLHQSPQQLHDQRQNAVRGGTEEAADISYTPE